MIKAFGYFFEILKGGWITTRHFVVNMVFHVLRLFGIKTKRRGAVTIQYPEQRREIAPRHRSLHRLMKREDGKPRCVVCMLCATVCPSECIYIEAAEDDDPEIQKYPSTFILDVSRCCFCGFCVEACPEDAIRMDTGNLEFAERNRADLIYDLDKLLI
ncbi:MAG: NADH-quinone oxidoreductase subunit I [Acidobacteria bacterium]|nr:NADH-quinone oxidoreductase subunit I [Acidobacteriota bacterium]MBU1339841.1 NADH-quinone oxidoreductase subunit I [Acidobacteriota bacterium]MBU2439250.1 NADH-quinone oxidoreductase subunit I [Acidobacteriota bacterium]MBU4330445.1 NADH-quinone oxidoreductase subunit I [Acidobacteriota bacterium]MCG2816795.1 NADH-quinone oxidoreductase subunit I [Candidatus Aminicenantes bacterium]